MEKLMKTFTKSLVQWVWLSLWLLLFVFGIFLVKWTDPLTAINWEPLTADKWNALVDKVNSINNSSSLDWFRIKSFTWTTNATTQTTFAHWLNFVNIYSVNCFVEGTNSWVQMSRRATSWWWNVTNFDSNNIIINTISDYSKNKPYKCIVWYKE